MAPSTYLRRIDQELVEAVQFTGGNLDEVRTLAGAGYRVAVLGPSRLSLTREHPQERVEVAAWDWVIRDHERAYAVRSFAFRSHCREVPVE